MVSDGGFTWPGVRTLKLGKIGEYTRRAIARRLGAPRDRVYEVTVSDPVNRDVVGATIKAEGVQPMRIPNVTSKPVQQDGSMNRDWYQYLQSLG